MVVPKVVEEQEWIEFSRVAEPESPAQAHAGSFDRRCRLGQPLHRADRHGSLLFGRAVRPSLENNAEPA
jgi:hypothetical protein